MRAFADVLYWEHRSDRSYDETDPSHLYLPNGTTVAAPQLVARVDRPLVGGERVIRISEVKRA